MQLGAIQKLRYQGCNLPRLDGLLPCAILLAM